MKTHKWSDIKQEQAAKRKPLWEQIADEWLNRGFHSEELPDGRVRMWYDGVMRHLEVSSPVVFPKSSYIFQNDGGEVMIERQPYPNNNWCIGCSPDNCQGCPDLMPDGY